MKWEKSSGEFQADKGVGGKSPFAKRSSTHKCHHDDKLISADIFDNEEICLFILGKCDQGPRVAKGRMAGDELLEKYWMPQRLAVPSSPSVLLVSNILRRLCSESLGGTREFRRTENNK